MDKTSALKARILQGMREYLTSPDATYKESDVVECDVILTEHLAGVEAAPDRDVGLRQVRETVLRLNALNDRCQGGLIETDQREDICALIIRVGGMRGFNSADEDVTEEWREW